MLLISLPIFFSTPSHRRMRHGILENPLRSGNKRDGLNFIYRQLTANYQQIGGKNKFL
jgi:hypothetical protein